MKKATPKRRRSKGSLRQFTAKYAPIEAGYVGQIVEWPEVISEGLTLKDCQQSLRDALHEMILAYRQLRREIPVGSSLTEQIPVEI